MAQLIEVHGDRLRFNFHPGQQKAWDCERRFICVLAGAQSGKTSYGPCWLWREIRLRGPGDYGVVCPTKTLAKNKVIPVLIDLFQTKLGLGEYNVSDNLFRFSERGKILTFGKSDGNETTIAVKHATDPESLESMTWKSAWLDEAGQNKFKLGSWEAIQRRLAVYQGRILITTTPYCYDEITEIYTRGGWKRFGDLTPSDQVLACLPSGEAHFETPERIVWEKYEGPMMSFSGGRVDLAVTPNHRIFYRNSGGYYSASAEDFAGKKYRHLVIPKTVKIRGDFPGEFEIPSIDAGHRWGLINRPPLKVAMGDWCAFMGWFLSEGSVRGCKGGKVSRQCYRVEISQNPGQKKDKIREDLEKLPFKWTEHDGGFSIANKQLWSYLSQFGDSSRKFIPDEIKKASPENLRVLVDRLILGDGTYRHDRHGEFTFYTTSDRLAEDFAEVCMLAGISTKTLKRTQQSAEINGRKVKTTRPIFHISQRKRQGGLVKEHSTYHYSGMIGCVTVSTGAVLVRRNGEECICGNSLGWLKQKVWDKWKKGDTSIECIRFDSTENPAFPMEQFELARANLPEWKFNMFYRGIFSRPAGLIYDSFDESRHKIKRFTLPNTWPRYLGLDFGGVHTAGVFIAEDPVAKRYYIYREYFPKAGRTAKGHVEELLKGEPVRPTAVGGSKSEGQWRAEFGAAGLHVAEPSVSEVAVGISRVWGAHHRGELFVFDDLEYYFNEKMTYSYGLDDAGEPIEEIEDKEDFHIMDAERYIVGCLCRNAKDYTIGGGGKSVAAKAPAGVFAKRG